MKNALRVATRMIPTRTIIRKKPTMSSGKKLTPQQVEVLEAKERSRLYREHVKNKPPVAKNRSEVVTSFYNALTKSENDKSGEVPNLQTHYEVSGSDESGYTVEQRQVDSMRLALAEMLADQLGFKE